MTARLISPAVAITPWYKQAWPWGLILGPGAVVLASSFSAYLAVKTADPLVVDDYYKQGLAINQSLGRDRAAASLQLRAAINFGADGRINVQLKSTPGAKWPASLELLLAHPSREERDQKFLLLPTSLTTDGASYTASASAIDRVAYRVVLHDVDKQWQLAGRVDVKNPRALNLEPTTGAGRPADD